MLQMRWTGRNTSLLELRAARRLTARAPLGESATLLFPRLPILSRFRQSSPNISPTASSRPSVPIGIGATQVFRGMWASPEPGWSATKWDGAIRRCPPPGSTEGPPEPCSNAKIAKRHTLSQNVGILHLAQNSLSLLVSRRARSCHDPRTSWGRTSAARDHMFPMRVSLHHTAVD